MAVVLAAAGLSLGACRRPTNSPDYVEASGLYDQLVYDQGDDAYLSPEMTQVEGLLAKVPPDSLDAQATRELLAKIRSERARVKKERDEAEKAVAPAPTLDDWGKEPAPEEAAREEQADGGPTQPTPGMALAEFKQRFGGCFDPGKDIVLAGAGLRQTYEMRDRDECRKRHPGFDGLVVVIDAEKVGGFAQKSALRLTLPDGGEPPPGAETRRQAPPQPPRQAAPPAPPAQGTVAQTPSDQVTSPPPTPPDQSSRDYNSIQY